MSDTPKTFLDPENRIERIQIEGRNYVLMQEPVYHKLLLEIESLDSALDLQRSQTEATSTAVKKLLNSKYTREQIDAVFQAPTAGRRLEMLRRFRNLNQAELAEKAGVSQTTVSNLESGKVKFRTLNATQRVLSALDVPDAAGFTFLMEDKLVENS
jgi:DNA-binding transcriptional regulator YiaG